jgi:hypothetical protein
MSDDPPLEPYVEKNAKLLLRVFVEHYPSGATATDLRLRYETETGLRSASFYYALRWCRQKQWIIGGGRDQEYSLNSNGSWKAALPFIEDGQERDQLVCAMELQAEKIERLEIRNRQLRSAKKAIASGETAGSTVATLVQLMADTSLPPRRRLQAAQLLLGFKSPPDIQQHTKQFLHSVFLDKDAHVDHRLLAAETLRRAEDVKVSPAVERPDYTPARTDTAEEIAERHAQQLKHIEEQARLNAIELAEEQQRFASQRSRST